MAEVYSLPPQGVEVYGRPKAPKIISPGRGQAYVDGKKLREPKTVKKLVLVTGVDTTVGVEDEGS
jgi:hypothetical protein